MQAQALMWALAYCDYGKSSSKSNCSMIDDKLYKTLEILSINTNLDRTNNDFVGTRRLSIGSIQ